MSDQARHYLEQAVMLAHRNVAAGGRPFGAVVVRDGEVLATGVNETVATHDPTAHAELVALRAAALRLGSPDLLGCTVYASGQPCPMCLGACHAVGIARVVFAGSNAEGAPHGLSSQPALERICRLPGPESGPGNEAGNEAEREPGMGVEHEPRPDRIAALYGAWTARNRG